MVQKISKYPGNFSNSASFEPTQISGLTVSHSGGAVVGVGAIVETVAGNIVVPANTTWSIYADLLSGLLVASATSSVPLNEVVATATAGQTVFTAPTYIIGNNSLIVTIDGLMQSITNADYAETTTTSITLDTAMVGGEEIVVRNITGA